MDYADHGSDLQKFQDYRPTQFDSQGLGSEGQEEWRVLPVVQTRDSDTLAESNFQAATKLLEGAGVEYETHRFGHWGPGWFEIIVVAPTHKGLTTAGEITCSLESYPVLDDEDYSERELEESDRCWDSFLRHEAVNHLVSMFDLQEDTKDLLDNAEETLAKLRYDEVFSVEQGSLQTLTNSLTRDGMVKILRAARKERREDRKDTQ